MRVSKLFEAINKELEIAKCKHVQALMGTYNTKLVMRFTSVDTPTYKEKIKAIANRYCESLEFANETKSTLTYFI